MEGKPKGNPFDREDEYGHKYRIDDGLDKIQI